MNKQKHKGEGTCRKTACQSSKWFHYHFFFFITTFFFFSLPHFFFFPKETPTIEDVLTYDLKTATSSPHSAVETTLKKSNVCAANREVTCIHPWAVLADSSTFVCHSALFSPSRFASSERHFEFHITCRL